MRYTVLLLLLSLFTLPSKAQTPPESLALFNTWAPISTDSIGAGIRIIYRGSSVETDSAEVAYGQSGSAAAYIALVNGEAWAKTSTSGAFPVSVELGEIEYYLATNPDERTRLDRLLLLRDNFGFVKYFGATGGNAPIVGEAPDTFSFEVPSVVDLKRITRRDAVRATLSHCDVTDLVGNCIEPPVPVVRKKIRLE